MDLRKPNLAGRNADFSVKERSDVAIDVEMFLRLLVVHVIIEIILMFEGCPVINCVFDIITVVCVLFVLSVCKPAIRIGALCFYIISVIEILCYHYYRMPADINLLTVLDFSGLKHDFVGDTILIAIFLLVIAVIMYYPTSVQPYSIPFSLFYGLFILTSITFLCAFALFFLRTFPFLSVHESINKYPHMLQYFSRPTILTSKGNGKNLIIIQVESLEHEFLGNFSSMCPGNMAFMSALDNRGYFNDNVLQQKYIDYSAGALFGAECGLPLLRAKRGRVIGTSPVFSKNIHCAGDYLRMAGYHMEAHIGAPTCTVHYFDKIVRDRGYATICYKSDLNMLKNVTQTVLPRLANITKPWSLFIETGNTHMMNVQFDGKKSRLPKCPRVHRAFDVDDQFIEQLFDEFEKHNLLKHTEILIYGDHHHMGSPLKWYNGTRKACMWVPTRSKHRRSHKPTSVYDIPWTIMSAVGIKPNPPWPWGASLFDEKPGHVPTLEELSALHSYWDDALGLKWNMTKSLERFEKWTPTSDP